MTAGRLRVGALGRTRTNRLARLRYWPPAVYTEHLTAAWRALHPAGPTPVLAVPRLVAPQSSKAEPRVAAICHIFYIDLIDEIKDGLANLPGGSDVYASVVNEDDLRVVRKRLSELPLGRLDVRVVPNRGRDIAPKYVTFHDVYSRGYDALLFLHTKKTTAAHIGEGWREHLYSVLTGSPDRVRAVLGAFADDPSLGVLAPQHFGSIATKVGWHGSYPQATAIGRRAGFRVQRWDPPDFPSGSMFWARPEALRPITELGLRAADFPMEAGQNAYTVMHALERLVFVSAARQGFDCAFIGDEATHRSSPTGSSSAARPPVQMWLGAIPLTIAELSQEAWKRRKKFTPARVRAWVTRASETFGGARSATGV